MKNAAKDTDRPGSQKDPLKELYALDLRVQSSHFGLRMLLSLIVFGGIVGGLLEVFKELAKTSDFVLEFRFWLVGGTYLIAAVIAIGVFFLSRPDAEPPKQTKDIKNP